MSQFLPNDTSGLGAALLSAMSSEDSLGIPIWQVQKRRVPTISALVVGNPQMRLVSFVGSQGSPPMGMIMSAATNLVPHLRHNIISARLSAYANVEDTVPEDLNLTKDGLPVEIGTGFLLTFNFASTYRHPDGSLGVSYPIYEITLTLLKVLCYLRNSVLLHHTYQNDVDLSIGYEPVCHSLTRSIMNDTELMDWNDSYELVCRHLCGSDQLTSTAVIQKLEKLIDTFFNVSVELNTDPTLTSRPSDMDRNHLSFKLHRIVSISWKNKLLQTFIFQQSKRLYRILKKNLLQSKLNMTQYSSLMFTNGSSQPHIHREVSFRIYTGCNLQPPLGKYNICIPRLTYYKVVDMMRPHVEFTFVSFVITL